MNLPRLAATRPVTVTMIVFVAILLGAVSLSRLSVDLLPEMNFPVAAVATSYEGAGPSEVESHITRPIEEVVASASNVQSVSSTSGRGSSVVIAEFDWGTDMNFATLELREKIDQIRPFLPGDAGAPMVLTFDPSSAPILELGMTGDLDLTALNEFAEDVVKTRLESIPGVASIRVLGGLETQVHVKVDPGLMRTYGIPFDNIIQSLRAANLNLPGGRIDVGLQEVTIRTTGEYTSVDQIAQTPILSETGSISLSHLADVSMGTSDVTIHSRLDGRPGVWLEVMKETGSNTVNVIDEVQRSLNALQAEMDDSITFVTISDESRFIRGSLSSISQNAIIGGFLAMIILFAFLRNLRTTIIVGVAIPVSIIFTFLLVYISDMTLNMMSLGGLALGVGLLIDNSIIVIDNIFRHRMLGKAPLEAADVGTNEVSMAIIASTITTMSVFVPVIFIEGLASQIFKDLSLTVSYSLLASLIVAMTLVPMLATKLLSNKRGMNESFESNSHVNTGIYAAYGRFLRNILNRRGLLFTGILLAFGLTALLLPLLGMEFMPPFDEGQVSINIEMPKGTSLDETNRVVTQVESLIWDLPDIESILATAGTIDAPDIGNVSIHMVPKSQRQVTSHALVTMIRQRVSDIPGARINVASSSGFMSGLMAEPVQVEVRGNDVDVIEYEAGQIAEIMSRIPGVRDIGTTAEEGRPELEIHINRDRASQLGLVVAQIAGTVRTAITGETATIFRHDGEEIDVIVRLQDRDMQSIDDIGRIPLSTPFGIVPLSEVATLTHAVSPVSINRTEQVRAIYVTANIEDRDLGAVVNDIRSQVDAHPLSPGVDIEYGGEYEQMQDAFGDLGIALVLAIILVYAVLASQFESFVQPFTIILTIPFSFIGVVLGLFFFGHTLNVAAFIGVIMLAGIAINNAIVLIDFINQRRSQGVEIIEAIVDAGRTRLRPILMTTLTTVLAMIPLLFEFGEGAEIMAPLAAVVVFGLTVATFMTLTVIPSLYLTFDTMATKVKNIFRNEETI